jgi:hypothetical protein
MSFWPSSSWKIGNARTTRMARAATDAIQGRLLTRSAQRRQPCGSLSSAWVLPSLTRSELMWGPSAPSIAGSSVVAALTATTTATAAVKPSVETSGMPAKASEQSAITTVKPAKTTAPPAVAVARAIDSRTSIPSPSCSLWRVTMKSA